MQVQHCFDLIAFPNSKRKTQKKYAVYVKGWANGSFELTIAYSVYIYKRIGTSLNQVIHVEMFSIHSKLIVSIIITKFSLEL